MGNIFKRFFEKVKFKRDQYKVKHDPEYFSKKLYREKFGRELDLNDPRALTEKLMYTKLKIYWDDPLIAQCADKYAVRKFVEDAGCGETLIGLIGAWDKADDIDWDILPDRFVLKCNHGCAMNIICRDKSKLDKEDAKKKLDEWMKTDYGYHNAQEGIYRNIKHKIIAEEFIETSDGRPPKDYKFFCSYGKVKFVMTCSDREENSHKVSINHYSIDWKKIDVKRAGYDSDKGLERPENLDKMIAYAEKLSEKFPLVRVDLYDEGKIIFGELTFTPGACLLKFEPDICDFKLGEMFPEKSRMKKL